MLDAAAFDVPVGSLDQAFRLALVTADEATVFDPTAGHVTRDEAALLLAALSEAVGDPDLVLAPGDGWRNVLVWSGARDVRVRTVPPFDVVGKALPAALPRGTGIGRLLAVIERSAEVLARPRGERPPPRPRREPGDPGLALGAGGERAAPGLRTPAPGCGPRWSRRTPRSSGRRSSSAMARVAVEGATGRPDSNLRAKAEAALGRSADHDLVLLHVDAAAACSHVRDFVGKVQALERFDGYVIGPILPPWTPGLAAAPGGDRRGGGLRGDRPPAPDPVPFAIHGGGRAQPPQAAAFTEVAARDAGFEVERGHELLDFLVHLPE